MLDSSQRLSYSLVAECTWQWLAEQIVPSVFWLWVFSSIF
uniref:Uncharacterized protein n=1 Tax=Rhizophora mucronata TaxID=61149 RepID=A0A2P2QEQ0_RHIMU